MSKLLPQLLLDPRDPLTRPARGYRYLRGHHAMSRDAVMIRKEEAQAMLHCAAGNAQRLAELNPMFADVWGRGPLRPKALPHALVAERNPDKKAPWDDNDSGRPAKRQKISQAAVVGGKAPVLLDPAVVAEALNEWESSWKVRSVNPKGRGLQKKFCRAHFGVDAYFYNGGLVVTANQALPWVFQDGSSEVCGENGRSPAVALMQSCIAAAGARAGCTLELLGLLKPVRVRLDSPSKPALQQKGFALTLQSCAVIAELGLSCSQAGQEVRRQRMHALMAEVWGKNAALHACTYVWEQVRGPLTEVAPLGAPASTMVHDGVSARERALQLAVSDGPKADGEEEMNGKKHWAVGAGDNAISVPEGGNFAPGLHDYDTTMVPGKRVGAMKSKENGNSASASGCRTPAEDSHAGGDVDVGSPKRAPFVPNGVGPRPHGELPGSGSEVQGRCQGNGASLVLSPSGEVQYDVAALLADMQADLVEALQSPPHASQNGTRAVRADQNSAARLFPAGSGLKSTALPVEVLSDAASGAG